ncbi:MAG TPA: tetratricopeptide repeat protein [Oculatellaceae cyanobacterium]
MSLPPREVPEGLTPDEYFTLGKHYKAIGWTEQARDALQFAMEQGANTTAGEEAARFLRTKIPKFPVPLYAEQRNIEGFNQMNAGEVGTAKEIFEELIEEYPDFEWPYGNLSALLLQEGRTSEAIKLLDKALAINSYYVNGWLRMATARGLMMDFNGARECVDKALAADPNEIAALAMKEALEKMRDL